jgi:hypothetical protein
MRSLQLTECGEEEIKVGSCSIIIFFLSMFRLMDMLSDTPTAAHIGLPIISSFLERGWELDRTGLSILALNRKVLIITYEQ